MSLASTTAAGAGLPITSQLHEPAFVRKGSGAVKQAYSTAQGFEEMLLQQLSQSLLQSGGLGGESAESGQGEGISGGEEGGGSGESGSGVLGSLLPQTLTEGLMRDGGLGLAGQLVGALDPAGTAGALSGAGAGAGALSGAGAGSEAGMIGGSAPAYGGTTA